MITAHGPTHSRRGGARAIAARTGITLLALAPLVHAQTAVLDWDNLTWIPEGISDLSETCPVAAGNVAVSFLGHTSGLADSPAVNDFDTGGLVPVQRSLFVGTDYVDTTNAQVTVFFDSDAGNAEFIIDSNVIGSGDPCVYQALRRMLGEQYMRNVEVQGGEAAPSRAVTPVASDAGVPTGGCSASPDVDNAVDSLDSGDPAAASGSAGPDDQAAAAHSRKKRIRSVWRSLTDFFVGPAYAELQ
jgi:hypothetical protein